MTHNHNLVNLFSGRCDKCRKFDGECASVHEMLDGLPLGRYRAETITLCGPCRKSTNYRGRFRADARHHKEKTT